MGQPVQVRATFGDAQPSVLRLLNPSARWSRSFGGPRMQMNLRIGSALILACTAGLACTAVLGCTAAHGTDAGPLDSGVDAHSDAAPHDSGLDAHGDAGRPCVAPCQCTEDEECMAGHCVYFGPNQHPYVCLLTPNDAGTQCPCGVGTCEADAVTGRGCCVGADGHIAAELGDPACAP